MRPRSALFIVALCLLVTLLLCALLKPSLFISAIQFVKGRKTIADRIGQYGPTAEPRLQARFAAAGAAYPPRSVVLLYIKQNRELQLYAMDGGAERHIFDYPILAASGHMGPKLAQGDQQVPEGFYRVESLNPNSLYHLSMRLDYPNAEDRTAAAADGRKNLGGDIMIHGKSASIGCIAIGDPAIEELFILAAKIGIESIEVVIAPTYPAGNALSPNSPVWLTPLYRRLDARVEKLRNGPAAGSFR